MSQELKDRALEAAAKRALYVEPHLEVWLSEDDFQHIFQQAFEAYDKVMATAPAPAELSVGIKPLDWQGYEARSATGQYRVQRLDNKWEPLHDGYYMLPKQAGVVSAFNTEEEAKAYAQSHHEDCIRAALTSADGGRRWRAVKPSAGARPHTARGWSTERRRLIASAGLDSTT
jgi:hypothetical protein